MVQNFRKLNATQCGTVTFLLYIFIQVFAPSYSQWLNHSWFEGRGSRGLAVASENICCCNREGSWLVPSRYSKLPTYSVYRLSISTTIWQSGVLRWKDVHVAPLWGWHFYLSNTLVYDRISAKPITPHHPQLYSVLSAKNIIWYSMLTK